MVYKVKGFPDSSVGKECIFSAGDPGDSWRRDRLPTPVCLSFPYGSAGKESTCNAGDLGLIPGSGRSAWEGIGYSFQYSWASLVAQIKESICSAGDLGWIPGLGRSPGEGNGYPLQYSCWRIPWTV